MILPEVLVFSHAAREWAERSERRRIGRRFRDDRGRSVEIGDWRPDDWDGLLAMYRTLDPAQRAQGLPPIGEERLAVWVDELWRRGPSFIARMRDQVVGHAALVRDDADSYELIVFVHQDHQGVGIGGALVAASLDRARREEVQRVWLSGDTRNHRALALYRRIGFERVSVNEREAETWVFFTDRNRSITRSTRLSFAPAARAVLQRVLPIAARAPR